MNKVINENSLYVTEEVSRTVKFPGCQCFNDCSCNEEFIPFESRFYTVKRKTGKHKRTVHNNLEEVKTRCDLLERLALFGKLDLKPIQ